MDVALYHSTQVGLPAFPSNTHPALITPSCPIFVDGCTYFAASVPVLTSAVLAAETAAAAIAGAIESDVVWMSSLIFLNSSFSIVTDPLSKSVITSSAEKTGVENKRKKIKKNNLFILINLFHGKHRLDGIDSPLIGSVVGTRILPKLARWPI